MELRPYPNSWLGYVVTENGFGDDDTDEEADKFDLRVQYQFNNTGWQLLSAHDLDGPPQEVDALIEIGQSQCVILRMMDAKPG